MELPLFEKYDHVKHFKDVEEICSVEPDYLPQVLDKWSKSPEFINLVVLDPKVMIAIFNR
jgi:hypothetical protein